MSTMTYPFHMEYRICTTPLSPYYVQYLNRFYPHVEYDPIRNMIIMVSAQQSYERKQTIPDYMFPKTMTMIEADDFSKKNATSLFYPIQTNLLKLYQQEVDSINDIMNHKVLGKMILAPGQWYQIYRFRNYTNVPFIDDSTTISVSPKHTNKLEECYLDGWFMVLGFMYNISKSVSVIQ